MILFTLSIIIHYFYFCFTKSSLTNEDNYPHLYTMINLSQSLIDARHCFHLTSKVWKHIKQNLKVNQPKLKSKQTFFFSFLCKYVRTIILLQKYEMITEKKIFWNLHTPMWSSSKKQQEKHLNLAEEKEKPSCVCLISESESESDLISHLKDIH